MDKVTETFRLMQTYFKKQADPKMIEKYSRFFRDGYDPYGADPKIYSKQLDVWYEEVKGDFRISDYKKLFGMLLESGKEEEFGVVIRFLRHMKEHHSKSLFNNIKSWVAKYFRNWAQIDSLCASVLSPMLLNKVVSHQDLLAWHTHESKWIRRCVPVSTIYVFYENQKLSPVKKAAELLVNDPVREVGQGVGWMLRDTWKVYPEEIEKLLMKHVKTGNRTAYQYACEKMDKKYRERFRRPKT
jgi:3-methyladenine DNA glycosylase AlkD